MTTTQRTRSQILHAIAADQQRRCRDWLLPLMRDGLPRFATKDELRAAAMSELNISRNAFDFAWNAFDFAWIDAIESTGRHDWYEPLPRRRARKI